MTYQELLHKEVVVLGCGNPLFGDDGFGSAVIEHLLEHASLPDTVAALDAGTSVRDILFDLILVDDRPDQLVIIDAIRSLPGRPGDIREISVHDIPAEKLSDFSLHQFPAANMLKELAEATGMDVRILVAKAASLPETVNPGLSREVREAVPVMCEAVIEILKTRYTPKPVMES